MNYSGKKKTLPLLEGVVGGPMEILPSELGTFMSSVVEDMQTNKLILTQFCEKEWQKITCV